MSAPPCQPLAMVFLCAGSSRRMGRSKALLPWQDSTILGHHWSLMQLLEGIDPLIVTQPNDEPLFAELNRLGWPETHRVINPIAPEGDMMESIRCGIRGGLKFDYSAIRIALIDQPLITHSTFKTLGNAVREDPGSIIQPVAGGRRGHPVILPRSVAKRLLSAKVGSLKDYLLENENLRAVVEVNDSGVLTDLDTPEAYRTHVPKPALGGTQ